MTDDKSPLPGRACFSFLAKHLEKSSHCCGAWGKSAQAHWKSHVSGKIMFLYSCFSANTVEQIIENLRQDGSPFAIEQMKVTYGSFLSRLTMDTLGQGSRSGGCQ